MTLNDKYQVVIGLEVHTQLQTHSKLFCGDPAFFGAPPNTQVSPVSLAHPGTLPVLNKKVIEFATMLGIALHCNIERHNYFARKNYFYPDLPKGYQVSQHTAPVCKGGYVTILTQAGEKRIQLNRIHIEEDAGKSIHDIGDDYTSIDLNRAGMPLLEIVTEPCIHSAEEAYIYLTTLRKMVRWLGICDGNMEEGSMRCDANISIRPVADTRLGTRVEVKNLNSIRNVKRAIEVETVRLIALVENNLPVIQETRSYDADTNKTFAMRNKEEADDYRYFPEPDLPVINISEKFISEINGLMPALPAEVQAKIISAFMLSEYDAAQICSDKADADFYLELVTKTDHYKAAANWLIGPVKSYCNEHGISPGEFPLPATTIAVLIELAENGTISFHNASEKLLHALIKYPAKNPTEMAAELNLFQDSDMESIESLVNNVLASLPGKVKEFRNGKKGLIGMFAGEVKKLSKGKADMLIVNKLLTEKLNNPT
ncbi:MAG TPA: Asp-tRNA(Asn)/Glu-tRNA(Gln) amidotransferase subunit GatB [Ferruginibacter sp.]|nr:Asp-tRNA(Asn)/Glu-tRNA(Gln) amidotransferase subunit GatB [Ferruginibacter sp.]